MNYHSVFCGDDELPKFEPTTYVVVRRFTVPGIESNYYDVQCAEEMAGCDDLAGAFDLRNWYQKHQPQGKGGVTYKYEVMTR